MRAPEYIVFLFVGALTSVPCNSESSIEFPFPIAETHMDPPDERAIANHRRKSLNTRCEFVTLDGNRLLHLVRKIEANELKVAATSISVRFFDGIWLKYKGTSSEIGRAESRTGPYVWEGMATDDSESPAAFVVTSEGRAEGLFSRSGVVYALRHSKWSEVYYLCRRDPAFRARKID